MNNTDIKIYKIIRARRKSIGLKIDDNGDLIIRAPRYVSAKLIELVVNKNKDWIYKKKEEILKRKDFKKRFIEGEIYYFMGKEYVLKFGDFDFECDFSDGFLLINNNKKKKKNLLIEECYKKKAYEIIEKRVEYYSKLYDFKYNKVKIMSAKKRWGSCSSKGNLNFSFYLIMAPLYAVDYVVVHELCHLIEKNHSKKFYELIESILPDYKLRREYLKKNAYKFIFY